MNDLLLNIGACATPAVKAIAPVAEDDAATPAEESTDGVDELDLELDEDLVGL